MGRFHNMTAYTAARFTTDKVIKLINQAHTFVPGNVVVFDGASYVKAIADSEVNCQGVLMVLTTPDANTFTVAQIGYLTDLTLQTYTPGTQYYVDPNPVNAGKLTDTQPTVTGHVILPCFIAVTASSGYFFTGSGEKIDPGLFEWITITTDQTLQNNIGYFVDGGVQLNLTLPAASIEGDTIEIITISTFGFLVKQVGTQQIFTAGGNTTAGVLGQVDSSSNSDKIVLTCQESGDASDAIWHMAVDTGSVLIS